MLRNEEHDSAAPGAANDTPPEAVNDRSALRDADTAARADEPELAVPLIDPALLGERAPHAAPGRDDEPAVADVVRDDDELVDDERRADHELSGDDDATREEAETDQQDDAPTTGWRRPSLPVIVVSVLLLAAIGAGLAFALPSSQPQPSAAVPSAVVAPVDGTAPAVLDLPTSPPLPEAIGDPGSTEVIAEVGTGNVSRGDFVRLYQPGSDPQQLLDQLIQIELVVQAAAQEGVAADEAVITQQLDEIRQSQAGGDAVQFAEFLKQAKIGDEANLRRLLERDQLVEQMILRHTTAEQIRARHILIAVTDNQTDTAKLKAEDLIKQLDEGADFAALAAENSTDEYSKSNGGELGWAPRGLFVPEFDEAVFSMQPGERRLVTTQYGFHVIELLDAPEVRGFDNTELLQSPAGQQAFSETFIPWVTGLKEKADAEQQIKILIPSDQLVQAPAAAPAQAPTTAPTQ